MSDYYTRNLSRCFRPRIYFKNGIWRVQKRDGYWGNPAAESALEEAYEFVIDRNNKQYEQEKENQKAS